VEAAIVCLLPHPDHQATTTPTPHPDPRLPGGGLVKRPGVPTEEITERFEKPRMASVPPSPRLIISGAFVFRIHHRQEITLP